MSHTFKIKLRFWSTTIRNCVVTNYWHVYWRDVLWRLICCLVTGLEQLLGPGPGSQCPGHQPTSIVQPTETWSTRITDKKFHWRKLRAALQQPRVPRLLLPMLQHYSSACCCKDKKVIVGLVAGSGSAEHRHKNPGHMFTCLPALVSSLAATATITECLRKYSEHFPGTLSSYFISAKDIPPGHFSDPAIDVSVWEEPTKNISFLIRRTPFPHSYWFHRRLSLKID